MEVNLNTPQKESAIRKLLNTYRVRQAILLSVDICCILIALLLSLILIEDNRGVELNNIIIPLGICIVLHMGIFMKSGCYSSLWRYAGDEEILSIIMCSVIYTMISIIVHKILGYNYSILFYLVYGIFIAASTIGVRLCYRSGRRLADRGYIEEESRVLLVGAGTAGHVVIDEIKRNPQMKKKIVGLLDDDINKVGRRIHNIKILGTTDDVEQIVNHHHIDEIIITMANVSKEEKKAIIEKCQQTKCKLKTLPGMYEIIDGKVDIKKIRDVEIEDLLGREPIKTNLKEISDYVENKVVLVTGGGGSIGSELCRQIATFNPKHLIIVDNYENNAYAIQQELIRKYGNTLNLSTIIASIREKVRME